MTLLFLGQPLLLSASLIGSTLLALALSAAGLLAILAYVLRKVSRETGEPRLVLIARLRAQLLATVARAKGRWQSGAVRAQWETGRSKILRNVAVGLAAETLAVLGVGTINASVLGPDNASFGAVVMIVGCLLANAAMGLLWLAGPGDQSEGPRYAHQGKKFETTLSVPFFSARRGAAAPPEPKQ